jgi:hypothetical protein
VKGITGESFIPESLILPQDIPALCDDLGLRTAILAMLPTFDESGVAVRQIGGQDPHRGIRIFDAPAGGPQPAAWLPAPPPGLPAPPPRFPALWTRAKKLQTVPPPQVAPGVGGREAAPATPRRRVVCCGPPPPGGAEEVGSQKRQRTAGGAEEASSQAQGAQRRASPPPPPPSGPLPPQPPPPGSISPKGTTSNKSSDRPASRVAGRSRAPSECSPLLFFH